MVEVGVAGTALGVVADSGFGSPFSLVPAAGARSPLELLADPAVVVDVLFDSGVVLVVVVAVVVLPLVGDGAFFF